MSWVLGTGFLVGEEGYVVTAFHVVQGGQKYDPPFPVGRKTTKIGIAIPEHVKHGTSKLEAHGSFSRFEFEIKDQDPRHDIALLKLSRNPFKAENGPGIVLDGQAVKFDVKAAVLSTSRPRDGEAIAVSGYPLNSPVLLTTSGVMATSGAFKLEAEQVPGAPAGFLRPVVDDSYIADIHVNPGNSGGPLYAASGGAVIGVCVSYMGAPVKFGNAPDAPDFQFQGQPIISNSGLSTVVPSSYVLEMLKKNNVTTVTAK